MGYALNDLARQLGNPIYDETDPESMKEFSDAFEQTEPGKRFFSLYGPDTVEAAWDLAIAKFKKINVGDEITLGAFAEFVDALILSGFLQKPAPPAPKEKKLSSSQLAWQEYRIFSETHSSSECRARTQQDGGYASYVKLNLERESINRDPNAPVNLNANRTPAANPISPELARFVEDYRSMPMDKVMKLSSPATNPAGRTGADHFNSLLNRAIELALV